MRLGLAWGSGDLPGARGTLSPTALAIDRAESANTWSRGRRSGGAGTSLMTREGRGCPSLCPAAPGLRRVGTMEVKPCGAGHGVSLPESGVGAGLRSPSALPGGIGLALGAP